MIKIFRIIILVLWMLVIFTFSQSNGEKSSGRSIGILKNIVTNISDGLYKIKIINKPISEDRAQKIANNLNYPARKIMHMSEYFILALLIYNVLVLYEIKKIYLVTFITSVLYAISDEIHQLFTGRTSSIIDVFVDSIGILIAICFIYNVNKIKIKMSQSSNI